MIVIALQNKGFGMMKLVAMTMLKLPVVPHRYKSLLSGRERFTRRKNLIVLVLGSLGISI